jgi:hypothetical protein
MHEELNYTLHGSLSKSMQAAALRTLRWPEKGYI